MSRKIKPGQNGHEPLALTKGLVLDDQEGREAYITLHEVLLPRYKEGKCTRAGATLTIKVVGTVYFCKVSCETEQLETTIAAFTLKDLLGFVDQQLRGSAVVWLPNYEAREKARREARL